MCHWIPQGSVDNIAQYPAPFKVVHSDGCSSVPNLELQLNTTVAARLDVTGDLIVNSIDVGSALATNWVSITLDSGSSWWTDIQYMRRNGLVFFKGSLTTNGGSPWSDDTDSNIILPVDIRPPANLRVVVAGNANNIAYMSVEILASGNIWLKNNGGYDSHVRNTVIWFDGIVFAHA